MPFMNELCFKQENVLSKTEATFIPFRAVDLEIGSNVLTGSEIILIRTGIGCNLR